jgi:hypothetical protein
MENEFEASDEPNGSVHTVWPTLQVAPPEAVKVNVGRIFPDNTSVGNACTTSTNEVIVSVS